MIKSMTGFASVNREDDRATVTVTNFPGTGWMVTRPGVTLVSSTGTWACVV